MFNVRPPVSLTYIIWLVAAKFSRHHHKYLKRQQKRDLFTDYRHMIYDCRHCYGALSVSQSFNQWAVWLALTWYVNFPNHFLQLARNQTKESSTIAKGKRVYKKNPLKTCPNSVLSLGKQKQDATLDGISFIFFFLFGAVCSASRFSPLFRGTRANHLKRRLSSIKRLEIFKGVFSTERCVRQCVCVWCARPLSHWPKWHEFRKQDMDRTLGAVVKNIDAGFQEASATFP